ncbi:MAG: hypothetical protein WC852_04660 [Candidatus Nanoarchaeia archaeon]
MTLEDDTLRLRPHHLRNYLLGWIGQSESSIEWAIKHGGYNEDVIAASIEIYRKIKMNPLFIIVPRYDTICDKCTKDYKYHEAPDPKFSRCGADTEQYIAYLRDEFGIQMHPWPLQTFTPMGLLEKGIERLEAIPPSDINDWWAGTPNESREIRLKKYKELYNIIKRGLI